MAEAILKSMGVQGIQTDSAGTYALNGDAITYEAQSALESMGLSKRDHSAKRLTHALATQADIILALEVSHVRSICALCPEARGKTHTLRGYAAESEGRTDGAQYDIRDPYGYPLSEYMRAANEIRAAIERALPRLEERKCL